VVTLRAKRAALDAAERRSGPSDQRGPAPAEGGRSCIRGAARQEDEQEGPEASAAGRDLRSSARPSELDSNTNEMGAGKVKDGALASAEPPPSK